MKKKVTLLVMILQVVCLTTWAQEAVDVLESTVRVNPLKEEVFYYGFAEGDQLVFNFEEVNGKSLGEVEILDMPSSSKFKAYKVSLLEDKTLTINHTGVYKFRLHNSSLSRRVCNLRIQRIPRDEQSQNFNTSVYWRKEFDTSYFTVPERYLVSTDTVVKQLTDEVVKVYAAKSSRDNRTTIAVELPANTVAWSCYVGTDKAGQEVLSKAAKELEKDNVAKSRNAVTNKPMAAVALNRTANIKRIDAGTPVNYWITEGANSRLFLAGKGFSYLKKGRAVNDYFRLTAVSSNGYHLCLENTQTNDPIQVTVNITAIVVTQKWATREVQRMNVTSRPAAYLRD